MRHLSLSFIALFLIGTTARTTLAASPQEEAYATATKDYTAGYINYLEKTAELFQLKKEHASWVTKISDLEKERTNLKKEIKDLETQLKNIEEIIKSAAGKIRSAAVELMAEVKEANKVLAAASKPNFADI